jgi:arylsulfatase A-like enzyme
MRASRCWLLGLLALGACGKAGDGGAEGAALHASGPARVRKEPRGPEHEVYSLLDNRLYAHVERGGGLVVAPGGAGFAKYLTFGKPKIGFGERQRVDDRLVALADTYAPLGLPLTEEQAASRRLFLRVKTAAERKLTFVVNGRPATTVKLAAGWQTLAASVPAGFLHAGENDVMLAFEKGEPAAVEWLQLGGVPPGDTELLTYDPARRALLLDEGVALVWYLAVPAGARLVGDVGGAGCAVTVSAKSATGAHVEGELRGDAAAVELAPLAGQVARVRLAAAGCPSARLAAAGLALPGPAATVAKKKRPKNLVLWVMDSLRADKLKPWSPAARPDAPSFTALAARGTVFASAVAQGNESRASYGSIWTSLYPKNHGMTVAGVALDPRFVTLPAAMKSAGLATTGATANGYVAARWGFGTGWDHFTNRIHEDGSTRGDELLAAGLDALGDPHVPFFLYLGTVDTHVSWRGKEPWLARYDARPYEGPYKTMASGRDVERMGAGKLVASERDREHITALYDSNVSFQDDLLGKLDAKLAEWGVGDDTLLVITADHGDELWEDGRVGHGLSLKETLTHVPLLVIYPPLFPPGTVVTEEVELVDLFPTLLDVEGLNPPEEAQGVSLLPLAQGVGRGYPRGGVATQAETAHALRLFGWKARAGASGVPQVYHLDEDPGERRDLADTRPLERRYLTDVLSMFVLHHGEWRKSRWGFAANVSAQMADDLER